MRNLWYIRQGDKISGPYPEQQIVHYVLLGRFKPDVQVSVDQATWVHLQDVSELMPAESVSPVHEKHPVKRAWRIERQHASRRWLDERRQPDRRLRGKMDGLSEAERRSKDRRKQVESPEILVLRQKHAEHELWLKKKRQHFYSTSAVLLVMAFAILALVTLVSPVFPFKVGIAPSASNCASPAGQQVNWSGCDKNGLNLNGAFLKNANLSEARLQGARLIRANLDYAKLGGADLTMANLSNATFLGASLAGAELLSATLAGADLRYSDLRGAHLENANLSGALLGNAVWVDGRSCHPSSIGQCR